ncbi:MAG: HAD family hydrolase [Syntrophomonadaceae bacterium]
MLKAITFDFWDTLYKIPRNEGVFKRRVAMFQEALGDMGHPVDTESIREAFYDSWQYANHYQIECGLDLTPRGQLEFVLNQLNLNLGMAEWKKAYEAYTSIRREYPPRLNDGVLETLPVLAGRYKLAVICNTGISPGLILRDLMRTDGIFEFFRVTVFSDEVRWAKPNVKIFEYTLQQLEVPNHEAAHVGDNSSTDVAGARAAGMTAVWLAPDADISEITADCDYHIQTLPELLQLF